MKNGRVVVLTGRRPGGFTGFSTEQDYQYFFDLHVSKKMTERPFPAFCVKVWTVKRKSPAKRSALRLFLSSAVPIPLFQ
jgi:hypothetical protein